MVTRIWNWLFHAHKWETLETVDLIHNDMFGEEISKGRKILPSMHRLRLGM